MDVRPGRQHFGRCGMERLWALIDALPPNLWPALLRGDVGSGNDATMCEAKSRGVLYLFKIKRSRNIQKLFRILSGGKGWKDCSSGWEALEQRALGTVAAFFRWLKSTAEHLDEKIRWYVVLRCAFRKLLMPEPPSGAVIPIR